MSSEISFVSSVRSWTASRARELCLQNAARQTRRLSLRRRPDPKMPFARRCGGNGGGTAGARFICCRRWCQPAAWPAAWPSSSTCCGRPRPSSTPWRPAAGRSAPAARSTRRGRWPKELRSGGKVLLGGERGRQAAAGLRPGQFAARVHRQGLQGHDPRADDDQRHAGPAAGGRGGARPGRRLRQFQRRLRTTAARCASGSYRLRRHRRRGDPGRHAAGRGPRRFPVRGRARCGSTTPPAWPGTASRTTAACCDGALEVGRGGRNLLRPRL